MESALRRFDPKLTESAVKSIVPDLLEAVDLTDAQVARHSLQWIAEHFYASFYL